MKIKALNYVLFCVFCCLSLKVLDAHASANQDVVAASFPQVEFHVTANRTVDGAVVMQFPPAFLQRFQGRPVNIRVTPLITSLAFPDTIITLDILQFNQKTTFNGAPVTVMAKNGQPVDPDLVDALKLKFTNELRRYGAQGPRVVIASSAIGIGLLITKIREQGLNPVQSAWELGFAVDIDGLETAGLVEKVPFNFERAGRGYFRLLKEGTVEKPACQPKLAPEQYRSDRGFQRWQWSALPR
jgi:hypothetical protein